MEKYYESEGPEEDTKEGIPNYPVAVCITCKEPLRYGDNRLWRWLNFRKSEAEHDDCYKIRFALEFPKAQKRGQ